MVGILTRPGILLYLLLREKGPKACFFFQHFTFFIFWKFEMSSTHCFLRTENWSIPHGVVSL